MNCYRRNDVGQSLKADSDEFPDLWGLTANEVANRKSSALLSLQEYHLDLEEDAQSEVRSIESVALYPLNLLLKNLTPFNYSISSDSSTPDSFVSVFQNSIKLYQLYTFYVYAISELGSVHGETIREIQNQNVGKWLDADQGDGLSVRFDAISTTAKQHAQNFMTNNGNVSLDIPVENSISRSFLIGNRESPLYIKPEDRLQDDEVNYRGMDLGLAEHLGQAKDVALQVYARYFNIVIVKV